MNFPHKEILNPNFERTHYDAYSSFLGNQYGCVTVLGIILSVTGIAGNSTGGILIMALLFGFAGSLISLFLSKRRITFCD